MRLSPLQTFNTSRQRGFTLLEVMVVVVIIGILFSMIGLSAFQSADRKLEEEARRFAALTQLLNEEAILNNINYAVGLSKSGYQFFVLDAEGKTRNMPEGDSTFRRRELPPYGVMHAIVNGEEASLPASLDGEKKKAPAKQKQPQAEGESAEVAEQEEAGAGLPKIFIFASGEMLPFEVQIESDEGAVYAVRGDYTGKVKYVGRLQDDK